ncbi:MAG: type 4a pilus biogenesis protein PilO [Patescibacteria group bacterium]|nr:type 4a pilus biogenesis protein PilO [Patescibacteria group bacterium]
MNPNKKIYLTLAIFGILIISLIVFLIYPLFEEIKKDSEELLLQKKRMVSLTEQRENLKKIEDIYKNYQSDLDKIEKLLPDPEIPIELISFLEKASRDSEVGLEISSITKEAPTNFWPSLSLQISITGSTPNSLKFLEKLENAPYLIEILNLNIRRSEKELKTSLLVKVYTK